MNFRDIQRVREVPQHLKLETLMDGILAEGSHEKSGLMEQLKEALEKAKGWRMSVNVYHAVAVVKDPKEKHFRKVVIPEDEFNAVCKREETKNFSTYEFLDDYLGFNGEQLSLGGMSKKYAQISKPFINDREAEQWYSAIAIELLKGLRREMFGPAKKEF